MRRILAVTVTALAAVAFCLAATAPNATASSGPVFTVMNTAETPPDGVWFRNTPHTADTDRVTGHGVYANERVQLNCYAWGDTVGAYANRLWYYVVNVSRPTINGRPNNGYLNAHYINDGLNANQIDAGVPQCGSNPPPPPSGGSVYYQPRYSSSDPTAPAGTLTLGLNDWAAGSCSSSKGGNFPDVVGGKRVTTLTGWSLGRLGPTYFLASSFNRAGNINSVILYGPGSYNDYFGAGSCDRNYDQSDLYARWLRLSSGNRLLILAGAVTADYSHKVNGYGHAGIQNALFGKIRGQAVANQVLVCNYDSTSHPDVLRNFSYLMTQGPQSSCPGKPNWAWHP
ncbi:MAG: hypothetical protein ACRDRI_21935 [Pseudonocardiaceae bacterium]